MHPATLPLLRLLGDARARSRAACARVLGVPAAAIDEAVASARTLIEAGAGDLRLRGSVDWLDEGRIQARLIASGSRAVVQVLDTIDSTNAEIARRLVAGPVAPGTVVVAEWQSAGRGRRGRSWTAPVGGSLAFSMAWPFSGGPAALAGLPLAVGVAVVRGLARAGVAGVRLKWPNDVLWGEAKLGGILIESRAARAGEGVCAIVGVGINVLLDDEARALIRTASGDAPPQAPADLAGALGAVPERSHVLACVVCALEAAMDRFADQGFEVFRDDWLALHALHGRAVRITGLDGRNMEGVAVGVAGDGALVVDAAGGRTLVHAGDVSLRAAVAVARSCAA